MGAVIDPSKSVDLIIALFPNNYELQRILGLDSPYIYKSISDVPWHDTSKIGLIRVAIRLLNVPDFEARNGPELVEICEEFMEISNRVLVMQMMQKAELYPDGEVESKMARAYIEISLDGYTRRIKELETELSDALKEALQYTGV